MTPPERKPLIEQYRDFVRQFDIKAYMACHNAIGTVRFRRELRKASALLQRHQGLLRAGAGHLDDRRAMLVAVEAEHVAASDLPPWTKAAQLHALYRKLVRWRATNYKKLVLLADWLTCLAFLEKREDVSVTAPLRASRALLNDEELSVVFMRGLACNTWMDSPQVCALIAEFARLHGYQRAIPRGSDDRHDWNRLVAVCYEGHMRGHIARRRAYEKKKRIKERAARSPARRPTNRG